jgi:ATP-binding protein involved in chromosome partitioning
MDDEQRSHAMARARWHARERAPDTEIPPTARVVAIASGKGGVGKSSVTVNLAAGLAREGFTVGVLDADIGGFSVPRMLGLDGRLAGVEGEKKIVPHELVVGDGLLKVVSMGFWSTTRSRRCCGAARCSSARCSTSSRTSGGATSTTC